MQKSKMKIRLLTWIFSVFLFLHMGMGALAEGKTVILPEDSKNMQTALSNVTPAACYVNVNPYMGSGFIINITDLYVYVVTNRHVTSRNRTSPIIIFFDGTEVDAEFIRESSTDDVGILRVEKANMPVDTLDSIKEVVTRPSGMKLILGDRVGMVAWNVDATLFKSTGVITDLQYSAVFSTETKATTGNIASYESKGGTSGSGIYDEQGYIIGLHKGTVYDTGAFFIPIDKAYTEFEKINRENKEMQTLIVR